MRKWTTLTDLATLITARGHARRPVRLSPDTALLVGIKLMTADTKPTRGAIIKMICDSKCERPCYPCTGKANAICAAYGVGMEYQKASRGE